MSRITVFIACAILMFLALPDQASARRGGGFRGGRGFRGGGRGFRGGMGRGFRGGRRGIAWRGGRGRRGRGCGWGAAAAVATLPYYGYYGGNGYYSGYGYAGNGHCDCRRRGYGYSGW